MHELAVAEGIVSLVEEAAAGRFVFKVTVEVGDQSCVSREALAFSFSLVAEGTLADGAELEIRPTPGDELNIKSIEVEEKASCA
jgi:hydrogenase nickel incorporation protein HypA/HybF